VTPETSDLEPTRSRLSDFLRSRQEQIIADWTQRVRSLSPARDPSLGALVDSLPQILSRIADIVESVHTGKIASLENFPTEHAIDRLGRGFDLDQIVTEYGLLRRAVLNLWERHIGPTIDLGELQKLDRAFDESIRQAAVRYAQARERLLRALDHVSEAALGSGDLDTFVNSLIRTTVKNMESVDTSVVLLREDDTLRVRAAVGLEEDLGRGFSMKADEGFAGHVAAEGQPVFLRDAASNPLVKSQAIRDKGVRALYGVPLVRDGKTIGVAHIGSVTAAEFSEEDKLLFRTMASRATSVIVQAQLVADLRRTENAQRFLADASKELAQSLDYPTTLGRIAHLAVPAIADWCVVDLVEDGTIRRVSVAHTDPGKEKLAEDLGNWYPTDPNAPTGVPNVVRTGRPEWQPEITEAELTAAAQDDPEHLRMLSELGLKAYVIVPIISRELSVLGTIALVTAESKRRYSEADLRIAEDLARRVATAIENARLYSQATNAIQVREQILAIVSHDLRNQLGVIATGASLLELKVSGLKGAADAKKPIETIQRTAKNMQHLVGDLLDMASIQAGTFSLDLQIVELKPILRESFEAHEPVARAKGVEVQSAFAVDGIKVSCDRDRILQVLSNLLGNAIKFSESGDSVTLRAEPQEREVLLAVSDTGPGIPPDELHSLFEAYRTLQPRRKTGTGLGLYITKGIIQRHGGRIWVESELGAGATFFFTLPRA
jgi:signal transduction histidine kinase/putative methionine-R-sulfoxide reductase with GAF domain